ncbi:MULTISPECIES: hypothetical protein [Kamptonema]|uniref:hypothetical protein n=1 Tax=Kamptonema TaxID=1501433 RepID=UPI0002FFC13D|nr:MULTISPECIES: hypothetical protein [Kamptonema]
MLKEEGRRKKEEGRREKEKGKGKEGEGKRKKEGGKNHRCQLKQKARQGLKPLANKFKSSEED